MRFTVNKSVLLNGISTVSKAVDNKVNLAVLRNILVQKKGDSVFLYGYDGTLGIRHQLDCSVPMGEADSELVVDCKLLSEFVKRSDELIEFASDDKSATLKSGKNKTKLSISLEAYPTFDGLDKKSDKITSFTIKGDDFVSLIEKVMFAVSKDSTRIALTGINLEISGNTLSATSCDGFRLAHKEIAIDNGSDTSMLVPLKSISGILKLISGELSVATDGKKALFEFNGTKVVTGLIDSNFVNWRGIIPQKSESACTIGSKDLYEAIDSCDCVSSNSASNSKIPLIVKNDGNTVLFDCDDAVASSHNEIEDCQVSGNPIDVSINTKYLLDVAKMLTVDSVRICFNGSQGAITITPTDNNEFIYLVLPVRR